MDSNIYRCHFKPRKSSPPSGGAAPLTSSWHTADVNQLPMWPIHASNRNPRSAVTHFALALISYLKKRRSNAVRCVRRSRRRTGCDPAQASWVGSQDFTQWLRDFGQAYCPHHAVINRWSSSSLNFVDYHVARHWADSRRTRPPADRRQHRRVLPLDPRAQLGVAALGDTAASASTHPTNVIYTVLAISIYNF